MSSRLGEGSTFILSIEGEVVEWSHAEAVEPIDADIDGGDHMDVLVVEDHPVNRMILEAWMGSTGHRTSTAENGQLAVQLAKSQRFDSSSWT